MGKDLSPNEIGKFSIPSHKRLNFDFLSMEYWMSKIKDKMHFMQNDSKREWKKDKSSYHYLIQKNWKKFEFHRNR